MGLRILFHSGNKLYYFQLNTRIQFELVEKTIVIPTN